MSEEELANDFCLRCFFKSELGVTLFSNLSSNLWSDVLSALLSLMSPDKFADKTICMYELFCLSHVEWINMNWIFHLGIERRKSMYFFKFKHEWNVTVFEGTTKFRICQKSRRKWVKKTEFDAFKEFTAFSRERTFFVLSKMNSRFDEWQVELRKFFERIWTNVPSLGPREKKTKAWGTVKQPKRSRPPSFHTFRATFREVCFISSLFELKPVLSLVYCILCK